MRIRVENRERDGKRQTERESLVKIVGLVELNSRPKCHVADIDLAEHDLTHFPLIEL